MSKSEDKKFERTKQKHIKMAKELGCSEESIEKLNNAENMIQLENLMIEAWKTI